MTLLTDKTAFDEALDTLDLTNRQIANLLGVHESRVSRALSNPPKLTRGVKARQRTICRTILMPAALDLGYDPWPYNEHKIFGLPEPDREVVVAEARQHVARIRAARSNYVTPYQPAEPGAPAPEPPATQSDNSTSSRDKDYSGKPGGEGVQAGSPGYPSPGDALATQSDGSLSTADGGGHGGRTAAPAPNPAGTEACATGRCTASPLQRPATAALPGGHHE